MRAFIRVFLMSSALSLCPGAVVAQNQPASVAFRNDSNVSVIVQGWTVINNMPRRGQPILVQPGKAVSDRSLPAGIRYISIYDAKQPTRVYLRDQRLDVPRGGDLAVVIRSSPNNSQRMVLSPD